MGLVFLRHAYSRYLSVKDAIEANLPKRGGKTRALTKDDFSQEPEGPDHVFPTYGLTLSSSERRSERLAICC